MKFTCSVEIDRPIELVTSVFADSSKKSEWQTGFERAELLEGSEGDVGTKSKIYFSKPKGMVLIETILINNLPIEFAGKYEHSHMVNNMHHKFSKISDDKTRYVVEIEYTQFNGIIPNLMSKFFPGVFRKQTQSWLDGLKVLVEAQK